MAQSYSNLIVHIVFSTKHRGKDLTAEVRSELYLYLGSLAIDNGGELWAVGGGLDHVHLLARIKPSVSVSDFIRELKARSSKWIGERFNRYFAWQVGYSVFSVSQSNVEAVTAYILTQETHHRKVSFEDEYVSLLKRNEIEFEEKYLWG